MFKRKIYVPEKWKMQSAVWHSLQEQPASI